MHKRAYQSCSVFGCLNTTLNRHELTFFKLPPNEERRNEWLQLINREDLIGKLATHCRVCEDHFDTESILTSPNRKVLKQNSLPKLLLPVKKYESSGFQTYNETMDSYAQTFIPKNSIASQTPFYLSDDTPRIRKLQNNLRDCQKLLKKTTTDPEMFFKLCEKYLNKELIELIKDITKFKIDGGDRYSANYHLFCLNLFYASPQAYNLLKDTLCLPSKSALKSIYVPITTKVNNHLIKVLETKVKRMTYKDRNCSLVMNVMNVKENLFYNIREDKIYGFHEIDEATSSEIAKYALIAMIQGMYENYKQPVGYALLSECKKYENITEWIDKLIEKLYDIGLNVRVFVTDMASEFLITAKMRDVSSERPYFYVGSRKMFYVFDPPNLMKLVRNHLINYDFHFDNFVAKWNYILQFYEKDKTKKVSIARKLTESHVRPSNTERTKVELAVQMFSATVAAGLSTYTDFGVIDQSAEGTILLLTKMNDLFDILNSSSRYGCNKYHNAFTGEEYQTEFINEMLSFFALLKFINSSNNKDVSTTTTKFVEGFQITLKSILLLFEDLRNEGYTHILTKRLNQDCLENFFDRVRARNSTYPTSWQLVSAIRNYFFD